MMDAGLSSAEDGAVRFVGHYYDNAVNWEVKGDASGIEVRPAALPWGLLFFFNAAFVAFFGGAFYLGLRFGRVDDRLLMMVSVIGIGVMTCAVVTGWMFYRFRGGKPWLVYDAGTGTVILPRESRTFAVGEVRLQWLFLVGMQPEASGGSELQVVTTGAKGEETFLLLTSIFQPLWIRQANFPMHRGAFEDILHEVKEHTPMEVICVAMKDRNTVRERREYEAERNGD